MTEGGASAPLSIYIGIPCYGGIDPGFMRSLLTTAMVCNAAGISLDVDMMHNCSLIAKARNEIAARFLASGMDALFFLDADIEFKAEDFVTVARRPELVVGGTYCQKEPRFINFTGYPVYPVNRQDGLVEMESIGTGFLRIKREVLETMEAPMADGHKCFFNCRVEDGAYVGEDYAFCRDYRKQGGQIWAYPTQLNHCGRYPYTGDFETWLGS